MAIIKRNDSLRKSPKSSEGFLTLTENDNGHGGDEWVLNHSMFVQKRSDIFAWAQIYHTRFIHLSTGPRPVLSYSKSKDSERIREFCLSADTSLSRLSRNRLVVQVNRQKERESKVEIDEICLRFESSGKRDRWARKLQDAVDTVNWLGTLKVESKLGSGSTSTVYRTIDTNDPSRAYALKLVNTPVVSASLAARNELSIHQLVSTTAKHCNVLTCHKIFRHRDQAFLLLDQCHGGDLHEYLAQRKALSEPEAFSLFERLVSALESIHQKNVLHLDLKPENILFLNEAGVPSDVKISDFGSGILLDETTVAAGRGTIGYAAPEVLENGAYGAGITAAADVFSLGTILYRMIFGRSPFSSSNKNIARQKTLEGKFKFPKGSHSQSLEILLSKMLAVDPLERIKVRDISCHEWYRKFCKNRE